MVIIHRKTCRKSDKCPQEDLAESGYRPDMIHKSQGVGWGGFLHLFLKSERDLTPISHALKELM